MTSPQCTPMRNSMRRSGGKSSFCLAIARWMAIAQTRPSTALGNSASSPSPAVLAMRPRCSATSASMIARHAVSPRSVASSSARINRLYSATSAARIVVRRRSTCRGIRTMSPLLPPRGSPPGRDPGSDRSEMANGLPLAKSAPADAGVETRQRPGFDPGAGRAGIPRVHFSARPWAPGNRETKSSAEQARSA